LAFGGIGDDNDVFFPQTQGP